MTDEQFQALIQRLDRIIDLLTPKETPPMVFGRGMPIHWRDVQIGATPEQQKAIFEHLSHDGSKPIEQDEP